MGGCIGLGARLELLESQALQAARQKKSKKRLPTTSGICGVLQMRKRNKPSRLRYPVRSTYRANHTFDDEDDDEDASSIIKAEIKQAYGLSNLKTKQESGPRVSVKQEPGLIG